VAKLDVLPHHGLHNYYSADKSPILVQEIVGLIFLLAYLRADPHYGCIYYTSKIHQDFALPDDVNIQADAVLSFEFPVL
jgi:hypothetical protein